MNKILLIEDDPFLSSLLGNRLRKEGLEVMLAKNGNEAVKLAKSSQPNLIIVDIILPNKSGFEVLQDIKADPRVAKVPVIILSNLGQESDIAKAQELGVKEYIIKAKISIDDLVEKIKSYLN